MQPAQAPASSSGCKSNSLPGADSLTDPLPAAATFYDGDLDPSAPGTDPFQLDAGTSGVRLSAANVSYSNNGGTSFVYAPASGCDANANAIRFATGGTMAANSSFTIKFRARIK